jgi:hypothetical protein
MQIKLRHLARFMTSTLFNSHNDQNADVVHLPAPVPVARIIALSFFGEWAVPSGIHAGPFGFAGDCGSEQRLERVVLKYLAGWRDIA